MVLLLDPPYLGGVPILDRPEERSQSLRQLSRQKEHVPILDRPEERSQSDLIVAV